MSVLGDLLFNGTIQRCYSTVLFNAPFGLLEQLRLAHDDGRMHRDVLKEVRVGFGEILFILMVYEIKERRSIDVCQC